MSVYSVYVEKKSAFAVEAGDVLSDIRSVLQIQSVTGVRLINRYFVEHIGGADFNAALPTIFSEPQVDELSLTLPDFGDAQVIAVEFLPGQFDQRADSCAQCVSLATGKQRPLVRTAKLYAISGDVSPGELDKIKASLINPVESREASLDVPATLEMTYAAPDPVETVSGFTAMDESALKALLDELALAMDLDDLKFCQAYFRDDERRDPTLTEIRMIDTYWSDHCRHTTFLTEIDSMVIEEEEIKAAAGRYFALRDKLYAGKQRPITLMDMAVIGAKALKADGKLPALDESEEINACSVKITVDVDGRDEDWLLMFKNETHNHPTEIEPFGGAATCLGGAIRDPLSGRSYVYQAMRVTGAGNPLQKAEDTLPGKLPQRKIVRTAAAGYSSYGNQIGLATGHVHEIYHPGYVAKRMEIGAVLGASPARNVVREVPDPGDLIILLGGRTGRDGCGGATGSSKSHTAASLETCGAEVQKGNAPEERKLQRLFRNPEATLLIRRCNDFGAGGVSVSIGELADGVRINLDAVPKKYEGLSGTELAISESQERMSVVVRAGDAEQFITLASTENLEATVVAQVTESPRLVMDWNGGTIVDLSREFLNSNGAPKHSTVSIPKTRQWLQMYEEDADGTEIAALLSGLDHCAQKGLVERFDGTIGAGSVLMPFGGARQLTPAQAMAAKIPVLGGETNTASLMAWAYDPFISSHSPYHGAVCAVVESVAKIIAAGGSRKQCWLTFQEYFERLGTDSARWGKPAAALLGALTAQLELETGAIGGKDSMSGSFEELNVPPTLVSFAVSTAKTDKVVSTEFKKADSFVYLLSPSYGDSPSYGNNPAPEFESLRAVFDRLEGLIAAGKLSAAWALGSGGTAKAIPLMGFGNRLGFTAAMPLSTRPMPGAFVIEAAVELPELAGSLLGRTVESYTLTLKNGEALDMGELEKGWLSTLEPVFPLNAKGQGSDTVEAFTYKTDVAIAPKGKVAKPRVVIPVFPGTNCEEDTARAFRLAGAEPEIFVIRNLSTEQITQSVEAFEKLIRNSQIIALPGGFSGGDEPEGSAKFITAFFRGPTIRAAVEDLLFRRDGLMCGICNGFQALVKLGLIPYGEIRDMDADCPTLTYNSVGRHQSMLVRTRIASNVSPWLSRLEVGDIHTVAISHGEGRFIASDQLIRQMAEKGQIATQYVDLNGKPTMDVRYNPNNSVCAIEGITSPDGRIFGKMGHNERYGENLYKNVPGDKFMDMFGGAVDYFR
ncbi:MAG: phosphoribosylformylglycinamidine synthase [Oscillospiraceae bacterium]